VQGYRFVLRRAAGSESSFPLVAGFRSIATSSNAI
jgi:hypothetical protein